MKNKKTAILAIVVCIIFFAASLTLKIMIDRKNKKAEEMVQLTTVATRETMRSDEGEHYVYVDENGVKYLIKEDGMYRINDDGTYTYMEDMVNIPIFQSITLKYSNGVEDTLQFNKDKSCLYKRKSKYENFVLNTTYKVTNNINEVATQAGVSPDVETLASLFHIDPDNFNLNNLYYVGVYSGDVYYVDENGDYIQEEQEEMDEIVEEEEYSSPYIEDFFAEYIVYLKPDGEPYKDNDKYVYNLTGEAYSLKDYFFFSGQGNATNQFVVNTTYEIKEEK